MTSTWPLWHFIGDKQSIWPWISDNVKSLKFNTVVDLFGGTGVISHLFRENFSAKVVYNDVLSFLLLCQSGLLANISDILTLQSAKKLWQEEPQDNQEHVADFYANLYFFKEEAQWIDRVIQNIFTQDHLSKEQKGLAFFALCQACLEKRPFNTFQNSHLKLRLKERSKPQSWDKPLDDIFKFNLERANSFILNTKHAKLPIVQLTNKSASNFSITSEIDLVYLDPPFIAGKKKSRKFANYLDNYHVLEAISQYYSFFYDWIDELSPLQKPKETYFSNKAIQPWLDPVTALPEFESIMELFQDSIVVLSYRNDSHVDKNQIEMIIGSYYKNYNIFEKSHIYAIKNKPSKFNDILFIAYN